MTPLHLKEFVTKMSMKRVNIQFEQDTYQTIKSLGFIEDKSFAEVVREGMKMYLESKKNLREKVELVLEANDEEKLLSIIKEDNYSDWDDFKKEQGFA